MDATLKKLEELAGNAWWSWNSDALDLFHALNPAVFESTGNNPVAALKAASPGILNGPRFGEQLDRVYVRFRDYMDADGPRADAPPVAYFCMEYGIHESLPIYAGGLGILAGDHIKAASDLGLRFTAIGPLVKEGYLLQRFDASGWQVDNYAALSIEDSPLSRAVDSSGNQVVTAIPIGNETVTVGAWKLNVGRSTLYLLDTDLPQNSPEVRRITSRLYEDGATLRIQQEMVLGIAGVRILRALNIPAEVYHLNEGHCSFVTFELLRERLDSGDSLDEAEAWVKSSTVFTTHTPVPAGHDRFDRPLFELAMGGFVRDLGIPMESALSFGLADGASADGSFNMTILGLRLSRFANGVSKLNGEVARAQWQHLYGTEDAEGVPIDHITNGIHIPTWIAPDAKRFVEETCGTLNHRRADESYWSALSGASDEAIWELRTTLRRRLVEFARRKSAAASLPQQFRLNPEALTIGFARRMAPYKRALLIFSDLDRARLLFSRTDRPIQLVFAGKAHPRNDMGKSFIQRIVEVSRLPEFSGKVIFLENYDMEIGRMLVSGCDVWLNNPRRPMEASGTSGQKVGVHGGLNLSILDGWWPEGYAGSNGWVIDAASKTGILQPEMQDGADAAELYRILEQEVIPSFYDRSQNGMPRGWIGMVRSALQSLPAQFSALRMVDQYIMQSYSGLEVESSR
ncbi:MAG TPA: alpha-glucan family phosphorylase [Rhodothermia bacterium]